MAEAPQASLPSAHGFPPPKGGWRCFFCDEVFLIVAQARDHFGADQLSDAACRIKVGAERGILTALRKAEEELARYRADDTDAYRHMANLQVRHSDALRTAEELGYERGLRDGRAVEHA